MEGGPWWDQCRVTFTLISMAPWQTSMHVHVGWEHAPRPKNKALQGIASLFWRSPLFLDSTRRPIPSNPNAMRTRTDQPIDREPNQSTDRIDHPIDPSIGRLLGSSSWWASILINAKWGGSSSDRAQHRSLRTQHTRPHALTYPTHHHTPHPNRRRHTGSGPSAAAC